MNGLYLRTTSALIRMAAVVVSLGLFIAYPVSWSVSNTISIIRLIGPILLMIACVVSLIWHYRNLSPADEKPEEDLEPPEYGFEEPDIMPLPRSVTTTPTKTQPPKDAPQTIIQSPASFNNGGIIILSYIQGGIRYDANLSETLSPEQLERLPKVQNPPPPSVIEPAIPVDQSLQPSKPSRVEQTTIPTITQSDASPIPNPSKFARFRQ